MGGHFSFGGEFLVEVGSTVASHHRAPGLADRPPANKPMMINSTCQSPPFGWPNGPVLIRVHALAYDNRAKVIGYRGASASCTSSPEVAASRAAAKVFKPGTFRIITRKRPSVCPREVGLYEIVSV